MKKTICLPLLFASLPIVLSSCAEYIENRPLYCVESSTITEYVEGKAYQASYKEVLETVYLISAPINPEANPEDYQYNFSWGKDLKESYFDFIGGLEGKKIDSIFNVDDYCIKVNINGSCRPDATYGYIKVSFRAFNALTNNVKEKELCAYIAISETPSQLVNKPTINADGTIAE